MRAFFLSIFILLSWLISCKQNQEKKETENVGLKTGIWRASVELQGNEAPFQLDLQKEKGGYIAYILNAGEKLKLDEIEIKDDSIRIHLHIFDAVLIGKIKEGKSITGKWIKYGYKEPNEVPFKAEHGINYRFKESEKAAQADFGGKWSVTFRDDKGKAYPAVGIFEQKGKKINGTFLTTTGDYRYLEGLVEGNQMQLSAFDGSHGFLFKAEADKKDKSMKGEFWAGKLGHETFLARQNDTASLPNPEKLTFLKAGYDKLTFKFPDLNKKLVSPEDEKYKGKVLIVQILGSWCPNCMDETAFLAPWYTKNKDRGVEIIGLAYERSPEFEKAKVRLEKMKAKYKIGYDLLHAGVNDKKAAAQSLPMLNSVLSFPTTIFIDRKGKVRKIHTGFTGPGTGVYYEKFVREFNDLMNQLLAEGV